MIKKLEIENFRQFTKSTFSDFKRLNFIVGEHGSGKSSVLEAIWLANSLGNPATLKNINQIRQVSNLEYAFYHYNVHNLNIKLPIVLAKDKDDVYQKFSIRVKKGQTYQYDNSNFDRNDLITIKSSTEYKTIYDIEMLNKKNGETETGSLVVSSFFHNCEGQFSTEEYKSFKDFEVVSDHGDHPYTFYNDTTLYLSADHEAHHIISMFKNLVKKGHKHFFLGLLKKINPYIENIYITDDKMTKIDLDNEFIDGTIYIKYLDNINPYPFDLLSSNFKLYFYFLASLLVGEHEIVLGDNVSSYLDKKDKINSIESILQILSMEEYANCQVFITTKDKEMIELLYESSKDEAYACIADHISITHLSLSSDGSFIIKNSSLPNYGSFIAENAKK